MAKRKQWLGYIFSVGFNLIKTGNTIGIWMLQTASYHIAHTQHSVLLLTFVFHCQSDRTHPSICLLACSVDHPHACYIWWCGLNLHRPSVSNVSVFIKWKHTEALFCPLSSLRIFSSFSCPSLGTTPLLHHNLLNTLKNTVIIVNGFCPSINNLMND